MEEKKKVIPEVKKVEYVRQPRPNEHIDVARLAQVYGTKRHRRGNAAM